MSTRHIPTDYLAEADALRPFYQYAPQSPDFAQIIADKGREDIDRETLVAVIRSQYGDLPLGEVVEQRLQELAQPQAFTVTTGHQLVLFGGPLFTVYKVMHVIRLAEVLREQLPNHHVVPIFWIHTEDHDYEEINHYYSSYADRHQYAGQFATQVGTHQLEESIQTVWPGELPEALQQAFLPGRRLADAFRYFFHLLFRDYGLVMLDASDPRLKAQFRQVLSAELTEQVTQDAVLRHSRALQEAGYPKQIEPREINLFYLDAMGRDRLLAVNGHYEVKGRPELHFSPTDMQQMVEQQPECFSPNVSLRPLYQEMILPNLAYVGGWGELSYWLQLKGVFDHFGVNFPLLLPRFSATVFPQAELEAWQDLGFDGLDIRRPLHDLYRTYMPQVWKSDSFDAQEAQILAQLNSLTQYISSDIDPILSRSADALRTKTQRYLGNLRKKAHRVIRQQQPKAFREIEALKLAVQPDGMVQERTWSLAAIAQWQDPETFLAQVYQACNPLAFNHQLLRV